MDNLDKLDLKPVESVNTSTQIMEQFVEMIRSSELQPGQCLPSEASLAKSFGASRATVREALSGLKVLGLLRSVPGKGNFIAQPGMDYEMESIVETMKNRSLLEALEARLAIECEICYLAAKRRTDASLREIEATLGKTKEISHVDQFIEADYGFHLALAKASENGLFIQFIKEALLKLDQPYYNTIRRAEESFVKRLFGKSHDDHEAISQAISAGDAQGAQQKMLAHLQDAKRKFLEYKSTKS